MSDTQILPVGSENLGICAIEYLEMVSDARRDMQTDMLLHRRATMPLNIYCKHQRVYDRK